jgi:hypothetical protein
MPSRLWAGYYSAPAPAVASLIGILLASNRRSACACGAVSAAAQCGARTLGGAQRRRAAARRAPLLPLYTVLFGRRLVARHVGRLGPGGHRELNPVVSSMGYLLVILQGGLLNGQPAMGIRHMPPSGCKATGTAMRRCLLSMHDVSGSSPAAALRSGQHRVNGAR